MPVLFSGPFPSPFSRRLYLRLWLAVVAAVVVLTLVVGLAWHIAAEHWAAERLAAEQSGAPVQPPGRALRLLDAQGRPVLAGLATRVPAPPGEKLELRIEAEDGRTYRLELAPRPDRGPGHAPPPGAFWLRPPFGFVWMLGIVGLAVALGMFPIVRRLLQRLEVLQRSMKRFGDGDLAVRAPVQGRDEVADLSRQFNAAAARIEALVQSHKSLLANASHELRSPLTRIRMGLELMAGEQPAPAFRAEILRNIAELDQLVDEILLASRLDAREADVGTFEHVDLVGLAAEECARVGAELHTEAAALEVEGVAKLLRRALRNLLENARRYSQGEITVSVQRQGAMAELRVFDRGPGVPEDLRERIFEPFYRLPGASERAGGVGLGLALVRSIARRHHGSVHCEANPGGGACFVLRLPLQQPARQASAAPAHAGAARAPTAQ
ncbi:sensor histidine kinase [Extensimonas vulgaris]|uniref:histidine kinase n=1 Tax=Extensimonas vulgaris TaxID=1031594 RepID=A0A369AJI8_9BURK|nr:ATP-binding protein [Extensimonas vulgaris]RCX09253.1 signal transduction histidine kinase [Extensimonas vulgaris]TWI37836.1 signal transduction histidine kinase [Extensimonas vulgaris]TXD15855.1 HAMP domain-containing protein [Extensimonas vulgaris]